MNKKTILFITLTALAALNLTAQTTTRQVVLSWTASTSTGISGYNVYRGTATNGPFTLLTTTPVTAVTYTDAGAVVGSTYTYQVTTVAPPCNSSTPVTQACGESAPATASTAVPPRPVVTTIVTVVVP